LVAPRPDPASAAELPRSQERLAISALALAAFALNMNTNVLGALLPFVTVDLALGDGDAKYLVAAAAFGSALGALGAGVLTDRYGRRTVLVGGLAAFVLLSLAHLPIRSLWPFLSLRAASGAAVGLAYAAASALAAEVAPYARRGAAMGAFTAGMFLAIPVGMPLSVEFAKAGYWPAIFGVQAATGALGCWWALRAVPASRQSEERVAYWSVLCNGPVVAGLLATMLHVGSFFTTVQLATTWLDETGRLPKEEQMRLWVGLGAMSVLGSALLGRLSDRIGKRNFVLTTSIVLVACFCLLARELEPWAMTAVGALLAVSAAARTGPLQALVSGLVPSQQFATLMGLRGCVMQLGVVAFALAAAPVGRGLGFRGVLLMAAGCQLLSYVSIRFGVREGK
jgi:predicted MFS family arabinose efflux permease